MENQTHIWEENYQTTRNSIFWCCLASLACFVAAVLANFLFKGTVAPLSDIIERYYGLIGTIVFGAFTVVCFLVQMEVQGRHQNFLSPNEELTRRATLRTLRGATFYLFMLFGMCLYETHSDDLMEWFRANLPQVVLVALGFGCLSLALLAQHMAVTIKTKYLSN